MACLARQIAMLLLFAGALPAQQQGSIEHGRTSGPRRDWEYTIRRLPVSSFPQLPPATRAYLEQRKCMVPQTFAAKEPENAIRGEFVAKGQTDWAVLCSIGGVSSLLVFASGAPEPVTLSVVKDLDYMQTYDESGVLGYSRKISVAAPKTILANPENKQFRPFDHEGIDDAFSGKASSIHYFANRKWLILSGSD